MRMFTILGMFVIPFFSLVVVEVFPMPRGLAVLLSFGAGSLSGAVTIDMFRNLWI